MGDAAERVHRREPVLSVRGVRKDYGARPALRRVSLEVGAGEFVVLLGPNGAGKTTLFRLLSGLFLPDAGEIHICGTDIRRRPQAALATLGVVFQQPTLDPDLSVISNLRFQARLRGMGRRTGEAIDRELARQGLEAERRTPCRSLSGGNRRRVELARALLNQPRLLLLDEPTVGLDPASRRGLIEHVRKLCRERRVGVLWATHLVDEAVEADRVVVLDQGRVLRDTTPAGLTATRDPDALEDAFLDLTARTDHKERRHHAI